MSFFHRQLRSIVPPDDQLRPVLEVAEELGIEFEAAGGVWYRAVCPVHDDNNPSLRLNPRQNYWVCLGCSRGGSVAHLYAAVRKCSLEEAVQATVRKDADALDDLGEVFEPHTQEDVELLVAAQLLLAERVASGDEEVDIEGWARALCETDDAELLAALREIL